MSTIDVEVHFTAQIPKEDFDKILEYAESQGCAYGEDPGKKEIIRRLLMGEGLNSIETLIPGLMLKYVKHKGD